MRKAKQRSNVASLSRQRVQRKPMVEVQSKGVTLSMGNNGVRQALREFWEEIMLRRNSTVAECTQHLVGLSGRLGGHWKDNI